MKLLLRTGHEVLIDDEDYERVSAYRWAAYWNNSLKGFYVTTNIKQSTVYLHRFLMQPPKGLVVDHINHDTLDNRRANLRICTRSQNNRNIRGHRGTSSKYKGVSFNKRLKKYEAYINKDKKRVNLGLFASEDEAARAYNEMAKRLHGDFALLNEVG